mgnify:CR=1 FL=1
MTFSSGEVLTAANLNDLNITSATLTTTATTDTELLRLEGAWSATNRMAWISGVTTTDDGVLARIGLGTDPNGANNNDGGIVFQTTTAADTTGSTLATAMTIADGGQVGIGTTAPTSKLHVSNSVNITPDGNSVGHIQISGSGYAGCFALDAAGFWMSQNSSSRSLIFATNETERMRVSGTGAVSIVGSLSKGSGTFDIEHPIKGGDWRLRHSFIEGPQADLIYRGTVTLVNGSATVDLDEKAGMTDGTWEALCRDPWSMASSSGNIVEWVLDGKTLTITSDTLDAVCPWIVMAERQDAHMASEECTITGPEGDPSIIVEYERPPEVDEPIEALEA